MKLTASLGMCILAALAGCQHESAGGTGSDLRDQIRSASRPSNNADDQIIARINGQVITVHQLVEPLIESYGLNELMTLVQLQMVKYEAAKGNIIVTRDDVRKERDQTLDRMFNEAHSKQLKDLEAAQDQHDTAKVAAIQAEMHADNEQLLTQYLEERKVTRSDFEIAMETNAYLRKLVLPQLTGKLTDAEVKEAFNAQYGEKVLVHIIQATTRNAIQEAQRRLARGDTFDDVARELSENKASAVLGGEIPTFTRQAAYPQGFKDMAFSLKDGEVSEVVQADGAFFLIKLIKKIPPRIVKFDDVKEAVRADLYEMWVNRTIKELRARLARAAIENIEIMNPVLKRQFVQRLSDRDATIKDETKIRDEISRNEQKLATQPSDLPPSPATSRAATSGASTEPTSGPADILSAPLPPPPVTRPAEPLINQVAPPVFPPPATNPAP